MPKSSSTLQTQLVDARIMKYASGCTFSLPQFVATATVIVVGWIVVHRLSARRDRDRDKRELIITTLNGLTSELNELLSLARAYHTGKRDVGVENKIKMTIADVAQCLAGLFTLVSRNKEQMNSLTVCRGAISGIRKSITGSHFEDEHTAPLRPDDSILDGIAAELIRAKSSFAVLRNKQFQ